MRIPADVLRRAVLSQVLAYTVDLGGGKLWTAMPGDCAVVFPQEPVTTDKGPVAVDAP